MLSDVRLLLCLLRLLLLLSAACQEAYAEVDDAEGLRDALGRGVRHLRVTSHIAEKDAAGFDSEGVFRVSTATKSITGNCSTDPVSEATEDWATLEWTPGVCLVEVAVHWERGREVQQGPPALVLLTDGAESHSIWLSSLYVVVTSSSSEQAVFDQYHVVPAIHVMKHRAAFHGHGRNVYMTDVSIKCMNDVYSGWRYFPLKSGDHRPGKDINLLVSGGQLSIYERFWNYVIDECPDTVTVLPAIEATGAGESVEDTINLECVGVNLPQYHVLYEPEFCLTFVYMPLWLWSTSVRLEQSEVSYFIEDGSPPSTRLSPADTFEQEGVWEIFCAGNGSLVYTEPRNYVIAGHDFEDYNASRLNFEVMTLLDSTEDQRIANDRRPFLTINDGALESLRAEVAELVAGASGVLVPPPPPPPPPDDGLRYTIAGVCATVAFVAIAVVLVIVCCVLRCRRRRRRRRKEHALSSKAGANGASKAPCGPHNAAQRTAAQHSAVFELTNTLQLEAPARPRPVVANQWITMTSTASTNLSIHGYPVTMTPLSATSAGSHTPADQVQRLEDALDHMHAHEIRLQGRWSVLSGVQRRTGGQGLVQYVRDEEEQTDCVCKLFFNAATFAREAALYMQPEMREMMAAIVHLALPGTPCPVIGSLPAWIVLERGTTLSEWAMVQQPDMMTAAVVLTQILQRLARLHCLGVVHRDIKPANILWTERAKSFTLIDYGCAAQQGTIAPLSFSLIYAAPEIIHAFERRESTIKAHTSLDIWSIGVVLYELLTKAPAFDKKAGAECIQDQIAGRERLPWESSDPACKAKLAKLGILKSSVLACLSRRPQARPTAQQLLEKIEHVFSRATTTGS